MGGKAGFYALAAAQVVVGLPLVFFLFRAREQVASAASIVMLGGMSPLAGNRFNPASGNLLAAFFLISIVVGGLIVSLPALLADRGV